MLKISIKRRFADSNSQDRGQTGRSVGHGVGKNVAGFVGVGESDASAAGHSWSNLRGQEGDPHSSRNCQANGGGDLVRFSLNSIFCETGYEWCGARARGELTCRPQTDKPSICETCKLKERGFLCHLTAAASKEFQSIKISTSYPAGARLFLENEPAKGIYLLCSGKVKLSVSSKGGKTLILQLARPGEILGLSATMSGIPYEVSAETLYPSQVSFIRREDFISFIGRFPEAYQAVIRQLNSPICQCL